MSSPAKPFIRVTFECGCILDTDALTEATFNEAKEVIKEENNKLRCPIHGAPQTQWEKKTKVGKAR